MTEGCGDVEGLRANDRGVWRFGWTERGCEQMTEGCGYVEGL